MNNFSISGEFETNGGDLHEFDTGKASDTGGAENVTRPHLLVTSVNPENYDDSEESQQFKSINNVYNDTEHVELEEEIMFTVVEEPHDREQAAKERDW